MAGDIAAEFLPLSMKLSGRDYADKPLKSARRLGVDAFRYCLAFLVVLLHATPTSANVAAPSWAVWFQMACRSAVPFFFIASGYFLSPERRGVIELALRPLQRLLPVYIFWMVLYFLYLTVYPVIHFRLSPKDLISGGAAYHLWFLPALAFGLALVGVGVRVAGIRMTGLVCLGLAVLGLAESSYHSVLGLPGAASRGGTLVAPAFVFLGLCLSRMNLAVKPATVVILIVVANALLIAEEFLILHASGESQLHSHDFVFSTFLVGASVFMFAEAISAGPIVTKVATMGQTSLGVYAAHVMLLWPLSRQIGDSSPLQVTTVAILTFLLTTLLVLSLRKISFLSRFVE